VLCTEGIERLIIAGIVTDGSVSSSGYVRDIETIVLESCAAFDRPTREAAIATLRPVARIATMARSITELAR
jgi:nicotinamidase-related amidase